MAPPLAPHEHLSHQFRMNLTPLVAGRHRWTITLPWELAAKGLRSRSSCGLGVRKFTSGGISRCLSASTVLIRPATPAAASRCPIFALSEPSRQKPISEVLARNTFVSAAISIGSPSCVPVPCASMYEMRSRIDAGQRLRRSDHFNLPVDARGRIAGLAGAVVVDRCSTDHGMYRVPVCKRIATAA